MSDISNAKRITLILEILTKYTDEDHDLSISGIIEKLKLQLNEESIPAKNTIKSAIEALNNSGFNIEKRIGKNSTVFYRHVYRKFELYELRMLIDAVTSARFITIGETKKLIKKIKTLTSGHLAQKLQSQISIDHKLKAENNEVRYHIDKIHTAIDNQTMIAFQYGTYNVSKQFILKHDGKTYQVLPLGLVWNNDYYYFIGRENQSEIVKHFRVDRMKSAEVTNQTFDANNFNITDHINKSFNMYPGDETYVELHFTNQLLNVVLDRFGQDINIRKVDDNTFSINVNMAVSEGLIRWLLTWGSDVKVISPQYLADKIKEEAVRMLGLYS